MPPNRRKRILSNERLFSRVSQITGISEKEFRAWGTRKMGKQGLFVQGAYDPWSHELVLNPAFKGKGVSEHEERHALQNLVMPWTLERKYIARRAARGNVKGPQNKKEWAIQWQNWRNTRFRELTNPVRGGPLMSGLNATGYTGIFRGLGIIALQLLTTRAAGVAALFAFAPEVWKAKQFRNMFQRHGEDGVILLWAHPPMKGKRIFLADFKGWEKQMIQEGLLNAHGGLTAKGEALIQERVTRERIRKRMERFEKVRQARHQQPKSKP